MEEQYAPCDCEGCRKLELSDKKPNFETKFKAVLNAGKTAFKKLYKTGKYNPKDLFDTKEYRELIEETHKVFTSSINTEMSDELKAYLSQDAFIFSGLKTHAQLAEARNLLRMKDGKIKPYYKFEQEITRLNKAYNTNYLKAEYEFAVQSSLSADYWSSLSDDTERYHLQYRTASDDRVRVSHQKLHNITLPKDDPFWSSYMPPNGWRCRCRAVEVRAGKYPKSDSKEAIRQGKIATTQLNKNGKNKLEIFRFNAGEKLKLFPPNNSYTKVVGADKVKKEVEKFINEVNPLTPKSLDSYEKRLGIKVDRDIFKLLKKETPLNPKGVRSKGAYYSPMGNYVKIPIDNRRKNSKWYSEAVVYHEYGHAIDNHLGLNDSEKLKKIMEKHRKNIDLKEVDKRVLLFKKYAIRVNNRDLLEKVGAVRDTIMSLNPKYGFGHSEKYFKQEGMKEAEFIAHSFENAFLGNNLFKKVMRELYDDMVDWVYNIKK